MIKFKRLVRFLPVLSILSLSGCVPSFVKDLLITSVKITPANPTIATAATQQFSLVVTYVDGQTDHPSPSSTAWSSDNAAVATIDKMGVATGIAEGTANIGGSYHGNDTKTVLTVTAPANVTIAVRGDSRVLEVTNVRTGQQMTFAANGLGDSVTFSLDRDESTAGEISVRPERGPAWLAIDPSGRYLYVWRCPRHRGSFHHRQGVGAEPPHRRPRQPSIASVAPACCALRPCRVSCRSSARTSRPASGTAWASTWREVSPAR